MSVVTLQLGQCGNQIGQQLFNTLYDDAVSTCTGSVGARRPSAPPAGQSPYCETSIERFFVAKEQRQGGKGGDSQLQARAVLVDMESKVIQHSMLEARRGRKWGYDSSCAYTQKRGSGNNWANGYCKHGPPAMERIMEMVQKQVEQCDRLDGFLVLMSVAGGTGSGVGALVTERLRDVFPRSTILNQIVWPYASGEVIVQGYNTILTTAHLQWASDGILLLQNDQLHKTCSKLLLLKHISFSDINKVICHALASVLQPSVRFEHYKVVGEKACSDSLLHSYCSVSDLQTHLCPHSDYKLLSIKSIPQMPERSHAYSRFLWAGLLKHLRQMLVSDSPIEEGMDWTLQLERDSKSCFAYQSDHYQRIGHVLHGVNKSLSSLLILRGNEVGVVDTSPFQDPRLYARSVPSSSTCATWYSDNQFNRYEKSCTLVSNSQSCIRPLDSVCQQAWNMYSSRAYIHQYSQYGLLEEDFLDSFMTVEQIIRNYASIT